MGIIKFLSAFLELMMKLLQLPIAIKNIKSSKTSCEAGVEEKTCKNLVRSKKGKRIVCVLIGFLLLAGLVCGASYYIEWKSERVSEKTENEYPVIPDDAETKSDTGVYMPSNPNEKVEFDIKEFNIKYYDDSLLKSVNYLPLKGEDVDGFIDEAYDMVSGKNLGRSASIIDAPKEVHDLLSKAASMDAEDDIAVIKKRAKFRTDAYDLCHNSAIARLAGHDFYKLFLKAQGPEEKLEYSNSAIQYFNRSLMLSAGNNTNQSYCALLMGNIYSALVKDETNIGYKVMLNLRSMLYMVIARNKFPAEGLTIATYQEVCYLAAQTYLVMLQMCKKDSPMLKYYYDGARALYDESLSDRSIINPSDEDLYLKDSNYLETIYREKTTLN